LKVGVPTEIKTDEYRVGMTPAGVRELLEHGHEVVVQAGAGEGSAIADEEYRAQGARLVADAGALWAEAEMVVKVKEPQPVEVARLRPGRRSSPTCHLAPDPELTRGPDRVGRDLHRVRDRHDARGRLPLLAPMSEVAGKIATQAGAFMLEKPLAAAGCCSAACPASPRARSW
jgi:alanine dehydrogenase